MDIITVTFLPSNEDEVKELVITFQGNHDPREAKVISSNYKNRAVESGVKMKDLDFSKIAATITNYFEFDFEADAEGNVVYVD